MATRDPIRHERIYSDAQPSFTSPLYTALLGTIREGVLVVGPDGRVAAANDAADRLLHYEPGQLVGTLLSTVIETDLDFLREHGTPTSTQVTFHTRHRNVIPCDTRWAGESGGYTQIIFEAARLNNADDALRALTVGTATAVGDDFIHSLARHVALVLGYKFAMVGEIVWGRPPSVRSIALWNAHGFEDVMEYELAGTPCEQAVMRGACFFPADVSVLFPEDNWLTHIGAQSYLGMPILNAQGEAVGILAAVHTERKDPGDDARPVLSIFAARAAAEFERKRTESALRESEQRYRRLVEDNPNAIIVYRDEMIQYANSTTVRLLGAQHVDEVVGQPVLRFVHPSSHENARQRMKHLVDFNETPPPQLQKFVRMDGTVLDGEVTGIPIEIDGEKSVVAIVRDVTETLRAQEAQTRLMTAIEQAAEGIVITDIDGIIAYVNPAFERITGYTRDEAIGKTPSILRSGRHEDAFYADLWKVITSGETWSGRLHNKKKDGTIYQEETTISPVRDQSGEIVNYVAVKRDITREVALEAQWRQSQKMEAVGQLAGGIAHDFNNLLQAIMAHATLGAESLADGAAAQSDFEEIRSAAESAASLTRQLLAFSRRQVLQSQDLNLNEVIEYMLKMIGRVIGEHIEVRFEPAQDLGTVHVDPNQMGQVLLNLCVNARDAMPHGGTIRIGTANVDLDEAFHEAHPWSRPGRYVCMTLSDTGEGMDEATMSHIFEPFFTTKGIGRGTGLGLATVYGIVKQHQGLVHVYSEVGKGSTFKVYFPRVRRQSTSLHKSGSLPLVGGKETILLAEDESMVRVATTRVLERAGYHVLAAVNGVDAVSLFREHADGISLALLDIAMPKMGGPDAARAMREIRPDLKVLFCSGYGAAGSQYGEMTRLQLIEKPYTPSDLLGRIRELLDASAPAAGS